MKHSLTIKLLDARAVSEEITADYIKYTSSHDKQYSLILHGTKIKNLTMSYRFNFITIFNINKVRKLMCFYLYFFFFTFPYFAKLLVPQIKI